MARDMVETLMYEIENDAISQDNQNNIQRNKKELAKIDYELADTNAEIPCGMKEPEEEKNVSEG